MAKLREEPESDEGSTPDGDAPGKLAGHRGAGEPTKVGVGDTQREFCDGQSLASPGRWAPGSRVYPPVEGCGVANSFFETTQEEGRDEAEND